MKKLFTLLPFSLLAFFAQSQTVVISQVYGGGGNGTSVYKNDFIELFNNGNSPVNLTGYSVQYASATGTTWAVTNLTSVTLQPGQYYLVQEAIGAGGTTNLPTPDATGAIAMSATAGKVALVSNTTALSGACPSAGVLDIVGFGATANCFEGTGPTPAPSNSNSVIRGNNGCLDAGQNATDFTSVLAAPRNTASPLNPCGGGGGPTISVSPTTLSGFSTDAGTASASQTYVLQASNLSPASGNINILIAAFNTEISLDNNTFVSGLLNIPYTGGALAPTTIYVRIKANASSPPGPYSDNLTHSGGGATDQTVTVTGILYQPYYNTKANNGLNTLTTWSRQLDGTGTSPFAFSDAYLNFYIVNQTNANYTGTWDVSNPGNNSKVIVGDGTNPINFTVLPGADSVTSATRIDVANNGTLTLLNNRRPFLNTLYNGSTVDYTQTGLTTADTIKVFATSYYNLKLTNGIKVLSGNTTTIRGDLAADNVINFNGPTASPFATVNLFGNASFINGSTFEALPSGDFGRITLAINGSSGTQNITSANDVLLFRLRRDSTTSNSNINFSGGGNLVLGNASGGGLQLNQGAATTTNLNTTNCTIKLIGAAVSTTTSTGKLNTNGTNISIEKASGTTNAGTLRFATGSTVNTFTMNCDPAFTRDSILIADNFTINTALVLTKGKIIMAAGKIMSMATGVSVTGGSAASFVEGKIKRFCNPFNTLDFPVGKGSKYAPARMSSVSIDNDYTVEYFFNGFGNYTIDPVTLVPFPNYNVSHIEYWTVDQGTPGGNGYLTLYWKDANSQILQPFSIRVAHFDGTDWNNANGEGGGTTTTGSVTAFVNEFSPFTFAAFNAGAIPVKLSNFTAQKQNSSVKLGWTTAQEINTDKFIIEHSSDSRNWNVIATVNSAGNSSNPTNYFATDNAPVTGINYYRLKIVDKDGKFEYSPTRSILFSSKYEVVVTPNPATDVVNVYVSRSNTQAYSLQLLDINGRVINKINTIDTHVQINISSLSKGMYFVKLIDGEKVSVEKVLVR